MTRRKTQDNGNEDLRQRAEAKVHKESPTRPPQPEADVRKLLHELQVHQVELEMQNEELQRATAELEASRSRYFDLFDHAPMGYCSLDGGQKIIEANSTAAELLGVPKSSLQGRPLIQFVHADDSEAFRSGCRRWLECQAPQPSELRLVRPDKSFFWARLDGRLLAKVEGVPVCRVTFLDVTDRKLAEQERDESAVRYRALFTGITNGVAVYRAVNEGADFVFADVNPAGECLSRIRREDVQGRSILELFPAVKDIGLFDVLQRVWRTGIPEYLPCVLYRDDRIQQWVANWVCRMPSGEIAAVFEDVTERTIAQRQVRDFSHRLLAAREDERRQISMALHHDLGSLAVGLSARLEAVADGVEAGDGRAARESLERCRELLEDSVACLKAVARDLRPPDLDLLGLPTSIRQLCERVAGESRLDIRFLDEAKGLQLEGRTAIVLFRIAQEALTNVALHASARNVEVRLGGAERSLTLSVADDGCGFDPVVLRDSSGCGMGCLAMRELAASEGGSLDIDSLPGHGTRVTVTLPRTREGDR